MRGVELGALEYDMKWDHPAHETKEKNVVQPPMVSDGNNVDKESKSGQMKSVTRQSTK